MTVQPTGPLARRALLFTGGPRLGWVFRDTTAEEAGEFPQPPPEREVMRQAAAGRAAAASTAYTRARRFAAVPAAAAAAAIGAAAILQAVVRLHGDVYGRKFTVTGGWIPVAACVLGIALTFAVRRHARNARPRQADSAWERYLRTRRYLGFPSVIALTAILLAGATGAGTHGTGTPWAALALAVAVLAAGVGVTVAARTRAVQAADPELLADGGYEAAITTWQKEAGAWHQAQAAGEPGWVSTGTPGPRADVFGGSLTGWEALLTTHGSSLLAAQPLLVVDLTGEPACAELVQTATAAGVPAVSWLLPFQLGEAGLLSALTPPQLAGALAEAIHADSQGTGAGRADRALDARVLEQIAEALGEDVSPARLAAATRAALGHTAPGPDGALATAEQAHIATQLFPAAYRRQIEPALARIEAFLTDLARHASPAPSTGSQPDGNVAYLTCLTLEPSARTARTEVLAALTVQWLTVQVTASRDPAPAVIIAGADDITRPHLERLADACDRRGVPLTLMFRHLREVALAMLGGGTAAFMRLGNHTEATQAADYIGRRHTFVLSQLTATHGGSRTTTDTHSQADTTGDTISVGWNTGWNNTSTGPLRGGHSRGRSRGRNRAATRSVSRTWSDAQSWADGLNWTTTDSRQRVYEYTIEPTVLQHLPDQALLLVTPGPSGPVLHAVECDPAIATLPGAATPHQHDAIPQPAAEAMLPGQGEESHGETPAIGQRPVWPAPPRRPSENPATPQHGPQDGPPSGWGSSQR